MATMVASPRGGMPTISSTSRPTRSSNRPRGGVDPQVGVLSAGGGEGGGGGGVEDAVGANGRGGGGVTGEGGGLVVSGGLQFASQQSLALLPVRPMSYSRALLSPPGLTVQVRVPSTPNSSVALASSSSGGPRVEGAMVPVVVPPLPVFTDGGSPGGGDHTGFPVVPGDAEVALNGPPLEAIAPALGVADARVVELANSVQAVSGAVQSLVTRLVASEGNLTARLAATEDRNMELMRMLANIGRRLGETQVPVAPGAAVPTSGGPGPTPPPDSSSRRDQRGQGFKNGLRGKKEGGGGGDPGDSDSSSDSEFRPSEIDSQSTASSRGHDSSRSRLPKAMTRSDCLRALMETCRFYFPSSTTPVQQHLHRCVFLDQGGGVGKPRGLEFEAQFKAKVGFFERYWKKCEDFGYSEEEMYAEPELLRLSGPIFGRLFDLMMEARARAGSRSDLTFAERLFGDETSDGSAYLMLTERQYSGLLRLLKTEQKKDEIVLKMQVKKGIVVPPKPGDVPPVGAKHGSTEWVHQNVPADKKDAYFVARKAAYVAKLPAPQIDANGDVVIVPGGKKG